MADKYYSGFSHITDTSNDYNARDFHIERKIIDMVKTATLVKVVSVDKSNQTLSCIETVHQTTPDNQQVGHAPLHNIPYLYYQAGNCRIEIDPVPGDIGQIVFCHRDITGVKKTRAEALPQTKRTHAYEDGVYAFALYNSGKEVEHTISLSPGNGLVITSTKDVVINANVKIQGTLSASGDVKAGNISLQSHVHGGVRTGEGTTGKAE